MTENEENMVALVLLSSATVFAVCYFYGLAAVAFPLTDTVFFFICFARMISYAETQVAANPQLEEIEEPTEAV